MHYCHLCALILWTLSGEVSVDHAVNDSFTLKLFVFKKALTGFLACEREKFGSKHAYAMVICFLSSENLVLHCLELVQHRDKG